MSELPEGWTDCQLGDLLDHIQAGKSVKCDERPPVGVEPGLVKISAVTWGRFDEIESKTLLTDEGLDPRNRIHEGELLISRANTLELVGAPVIVHAVTKNLYLSDKVLRLDLPQILRPWALICLKSKAGRSQIESLATGNQLSMRNISQDALRSIRIPLPPEAEQKRIAQKLDALLAQVDTLKARIDAIPALLKRFRRAALSAMLSNSEMQGVENWSTSSIADLCTASFDGPFGSKLKSDDYTDAGVRVVRLENIGHLNFVQDKVTYVSVEKGSALSKNRLFEGDVLFSSFVDEEIRVCQLPRSEEVFINKADCFCLRVKPELVDAKFLMLALSTRETYQRVRESVHGATRPRINLSFLKSFEIRLPHPDEQAEIVSRVEQLFAFADQLEARVSAAQKRIDALTQSLLAKAFRGELVPQGPNDEPASVLLERIRAQRAAAPKPRRGRKAAAN